jgi:TolB protein
VCKKLNTYSPITLIFVLASFVSSLFFVPSGAEARVYLDITSPETRKIQFAVPWFTPASGQADKLSKDLSDTLAKALKFHGIISIIPTSKYNGSQSADWKKYGADFVILGKYNLQGDKISLEMRMLDISTGDMITGKSYNGTKKQQDSMLFKFCDSVIKDLTGISGIASSKIAFVSQKNKRKDVFLTDILGKKFRQVTRHNNLVVSPRFTPDGNFLTYTSYHTGNQNLYITDLRQNKTTRVLSRRRGMNLAPAWSPSGNEMILTLSKDGNPDLYRLDKRGKIRNRITKNNGINVSATFSPDGKKIAFVSDRSGKPQIYLMTLGTKKEQRITFKGSENSEPSWSPTENLIVYSSLIDGVYQLFTIEPKRGAQPTQITHDLSHHESPSWSPDGNQIIFTKRDGAQHKIYGIMKNGSFQRRLFSLPGSQSYPQWSGK